MISPSGQLVGGLQAEDAGEDEAGVGDRGVGQQALDVALGDGQRGTDEHRQHGDDPQHRLPRPAVRAEGDVEQAHDRAEGGDLGAGRHERGDRGRGALVDVGGPRLERHGADLEEQADREQARADEQQAGAADVVAHGLVDRGEVHGAGEAVEQRRAVEEEAGGEGAEEEVLERRLLAQQAAAARQPAQQVEREREDLEADEHRQQVVGRREEHHAEDREHHQRVDLGVLAVGRERRGLRVGAGHRGGLAGEGRDPAVEVPLGEEQDAGDGQRQHQAPDEEAGPVDGDRAADREDAARGAVVVRLARPGRPAPRRRGRRRGRRGPARPGRRSAAARGANASTTTPRQATPKTTSSGQSSKYSTLGFTNSVTGDHPPGRCPRPRGCRGRRD